MQDTDAEELSHLIGAFYDAALDPGQWTETLERAARFLDGAGVNIFWQDATTQAAVVFHSWGDDPAYTESYLREYIAINPFFPAMSFVQPGVVFSGGDLIPHEDFAKTRFFREWVAPQGYIDVIGVNLHRFAMTVSSFTVRRSREQGYVDDEMRRRLALLVPHIRRAAAIGREIDGRRTQAANLEAVLDRVAAGALLVDADGRVDYANEPGRALLDRGDPLVARDGILHAAGREEEKRLRTALAATASPHAVSKEAPEASLVLAGRDGERYLAHILPLATGDRLRSSQGGPASAAVFVRRAEIPIVSGIELVAKLHGLTPGEIKVLQAVMANAGVSEMAASLGLSATTVKTHLGALFAKTGARRQSDLVKQVAAHGSPFLFT
ncbi:LuxR C-terminal-related transcriptional regulator [uncultured Methylobacterium sp.]|jgi:DNA-binding CsgD family transcriptional regulator/PAS domain-containing protein|uniref:helix-turn-helix transcriptional regulator n=1 Tax=uncultured Methylobacterium sp. TaxID=157278 RepID=UPI002631D5CB|nr:LuxR C-terminal-related transcriptional regulator [uncultured Methylobacterium sp.]